MKKVKIYTAVYHRFLKTKFSLDSIIESINQSENDVNLMIGVNGSESDEMTEWLKGLACDKVKVFIAEENMGKGAVINYMHQQEGDGDDYFISVDSDMVAYENEKYNWIDQLVRLMEFEPAQNFGLFSTWQDENNCHNLPLLTERTEFLGQLIWYGAYWGVAGGCLIMRNQDFIDVGRYYIHDIYSGDDAYLMVNVSNKLKKLVGVTATIRLKHLENLPEEEEYQNWKVAKCFGKLPVGANTKGFWDE